MRRTKVSGAARWALGTLAATGMLMVWDLPARAHGPQAADEPVTRFEQFLLESCSPCVKESALIATLPVPPVKLPAWSRTTGVRTTRPGEIIVEALRSHLLGRPSRQLLAVRVTLAVATGNPGEMYRVAAGVVDEEEMGAFVSSLGEIVQAASSSQDTGADTVELDLHSGTLRVGVIRLKGESTVYIQAGDVRMFTRRPVWDAPATHYLPVTDLPALRNVMAEAAARVVKMRGGQ